MEGKLLDDQGILSFVVNCVHLEQRGIMRVYVLLGKRDTKHDRETKRIKALSNALKINNYDSKPIFQSCG